MTDQSSEMEKNIYWDGNQNALDFYFKAEYAKSNRSKCKACQKAIDKGEVRVATHAPADFDGTIAENYHPACLFKSLGKQYEMAIEMSGIEGKDKKTLVNMCATEAEAEEGSPSEEVEFEIKEEDKVFLPKVRRMFDKLCTTLELRSILKTNQLSDVGSRKQLLNRAAKGMLAGCTPGDHAMCEWKATYDFASRARQYRREHGKDEVKEEEEEEEEETKPAPKSSKKTEKQAKAKEPAKKKAKLTEKEEEEEEEAEPQPAKKGGKKATKKAKPAEEEEDANEEKVDYSKLKVTELREELKKKGLPTAGLKAELVERLTNA